MPVTLRLTFPGGRFHATPWGRHVNEGVPEWPPSPWRLLRALVAVWKRTLPDLQKEQVQPVLMALTGPPVYHLPAYRVAHTRHYMPWEKKGPADRTLVFDTFVAVGRKDPLHIHWPDATLAGDDEVVLRRLADNLTTFGRAEGWVEAAVVSFPEGTPPPVWNCVPADAADPSPVPVLCPDGDAAFADDHYPTLDPKKLKQRLVNPKEFLFDCPRWHLCLDTQTIHAEKWPRVPGAAWVNYTVPPAGSAPAARPPAVPKDQPTVARFLLDGPVLPLVTDTVPVAEAVRKAVMGRFEKWCRGHAAAAAGYRRTDAPGRFASPVLSGKDAAGVMLRDHRHAHYLPTAEGADTRRITHVTVWADGTFGPGEVAALTGLRSLKIGDHDPLRVQLVGLGRPRDFTADLFGASRVWESVTPFVAHRSLKRRGAKRDVLPADGRDPKTAFMEQCLRELADRLGLAKVADVTPLPPAAGRPRSVEFRRARDRRADDGWRRPHGLFRVTFAVPVAGPLAVGYAGHYGLGLFRPAEVERRPRGGTVDPAQAPRS